MTDLQTAYQKAILFAAGKHAVKNQLVPGTNLPYVIHLSNVAMEIFVAAQNTPEFDTLFAVQVALLHDTLEDTETTIEEIAQLFNGEIAQAVSALTKNPDLPSDKKMPDSLLRIARCRKEVWAVKLADRITNLQAPPADWNPDKIDDYRNGAIQIGDALKGGNPYLENRLALKIRNYPGSKPTLSGQ